MKSPGSGLLWDFWPPDESSTASDRCIAGPCDPDRLRCPHGRLRGGLPRAAGVVPEPQPDLPPVLRAEVLLPVHLRVLLQPLRNIVLSGRDALQVAVR